MRLIDAEAFFEEEFKRCGDFPLVGTCSKDNEYLGNRLSVAPTIEAKPIVHAHWKHHMQCSECGQVDTTEPNFCPHCGAQMDEKEG